MTKNERVAKRIMADAVEPDEDQILEAWRLVFDREPDDDDREQGLYSHLCAALDISE